MIISTIIAIIIIYIIIFIISINTIIIMTITTITTIIRFQLLNIVLVFGVTLSVFPAVLSGDRNQNLF